ncbi:hypothetical protein BAPA111461_01700 [Bacillus paramycoides]
MITKANEEETKQNKYYIMQLNLFSKEREGIVN